MRTLFLVWAFLIGMQLPSFGQEIFIKTGFNSTTYDFRSVSGDQLLEFSPGIGSSIQTGMGFPFLLKKSKEDSTQVGPSYSPHWFKNEVSLNLDSFNSFGGNSNNNYSWETTYGGLTNTLSFLAHFGEVELGIKGILGASGMLSGTQVINSSRFPLMGQDDFSGIFARRGGGVSASYPVFQRGFLNLTYTYTKSSRLGGPADQRVSFLTQSLMFGVYVQLN
jgi:hypothetical protein